MSGCTIACFTLSSHTTPAAMGRRVSLPHLSLTGLIQGAGGSSQDPLTALHVAGPIECKWMACVDAMVAEKYQFFPPSLPWSRL